MTAATVPEPPYHSIGGAYRGSEPAFHDPASVPGADRVRAAWTTIRDEVAALRASTPLKENFDPYGFGIRGWRTLNLRTYGRRYHANCRRLPLTTSIVEQVPGLTSAFVNVLEPGCRIPVHPGDSNTIWRCHLGLVVPGGADECAIEVAGQRRGWQEGELLVFTDAHPHSAWNESSRPRVVLVFDVMKPAYRPRANAICGDVLGAIALTGLETRLGRTLPEAPRRWLHRALGLGFRAALPLQRLMGAQTRPTSAPAR